MIMICQRHTQAQASLSTNRHDHCRRDSCKDSARARTAGPGGARMCQLNRRRSE